MGPRTFHQVFHLALVDKNIRLKKKRLLPSVDREMKTEMTGTESSPKLPCHVGLKSASKARTKSTRRWGKQAKSSGVAVLR